MNTAIMTMGGLRPPAHRIAVKSELAAELAARG